MLKKGIASQPKGGFRKDLSCYFRSKNEIYNTLKRN